jgi:hypothetical protein
MNRISKDALIKKFPYDFACRVWYKGQKDYISYSSHKNVNWKKVHRITVIFPEAKKKYVGNGDYGTRDGATYLLEN